MITKIEKLKNIGNFEDYTASGDVTLNKLSVVYANNGAGKTTLARVLHSLSTNDPGVVLRHKRESGGQELLFRRQAIRYNISPQESLFKYSREP